MRERLEVAGINSNGYSGHSLPAGVATSAAQAGISSWKIRQQTGHASDAMLARYIRESELFTDNAAGSYSEHRSLRRTFPRLRCRADLSEKQALIQLPTASKGNVGSVGLSGSMATPAPTSLPSKSRGSPKHASLGDGAVPADRESV